MEKKHILIPLLCLLLAAIISPSAATAQSLSRSGAAHLKAAQALKSMASTTDDNLQVAEEYEKIIESDPAYADAFVEAARIYSTLVPQLGSAAYDKAETLFRRYAELRPAEASDVDAELIVLEAMLRKYNNGPNRLDGIWQGRKGGTSGFVDYIEVFNGGADIQVLNASEWVPGEVRSMDISINGNKCSLAIKYYWDDRPELGKHGLDYYVGDRDVYADSEYPRSGEFRYNESLNTIYFSIDMTKIPLIIKCEKEIREEYLLNGNMTYSRKRPWPGISDIVLTKKQ